MAVSAHYTCTVHMPYSVYSAKLAHLLSLAPQGFPQRTVDPDRFRTIDSVPEGMEGDADYKRTVEELESGIMARAGWLASSGAFDKGDLLYLRWVRGPPGYPESRPLRPAAGAPPPAAYCSLPPRVPPPDGAAPRPTGTRRSARSTWPASRRRGRLRSLRGPGAPSTRRPRRGQGRWRRRPRPRPRGGPAKRPAAGENCCLLSG